MKQFRYHPLSTTYKTLSTLLCNTALNIRTTDFTDEETWTNLIKQVNKICAVFAIQAEKEENTLFSILHNYEPALVAILRDDQCERMRYLNELFALLATKKTSTHKHKIKLYSHKLMYRLHEFVAAATQQLNENEIMINAVLWRYYSDDELIQLADLFSLPVSVPTHQRDVTFADEIIKKLMPDTVFKSTLKHNDTSKAYLQQHGAKRLAFAI